MVAGASASIIIVVARLVVRLLRKAEREDVRLCVWLHHDVVDEVVAMPMIILHACVWWSGVGIRVYTRVYSLLFILYIPAYTMKFPSST
jgi:hypothetical protein